MSQECLGMNSHKITEWNCRDLRGQRFNILKRDGGGRRPSQKMENKKVLKKLALATVGLVCPVNAPTVIWAKFLLLSSK